MNKNEIECRLWSLVGYTRVVIFNLTVSSECVHDVVCSSKRMSSSLFVTHAGNERTSERARNYKAFRVNVISLFFFSPRSPWTTVFDVIAGVLWNLITVSWSDFWPSDFIRFYLTRYEYACALFAYGCITNMFLNLAYYLHHQNLFSSRKNKHFSCFTLIHWLLISNLLFHSLIERMYIHFIIKEVRNRIVKIKKRKKRIEK